MSEPPPGWAEATIPEVIGARGLFSDGDWVESKDQDPNGDVRLIQLADIGDGAFRDRSSRFLTSEAAARLRCTFLERGDVLVARMPDPLGRACLFPGVGQASVTAVDVCIVRPGEGSVDPRWLMWFINSSSFRSDVLALQAGTTRKRISRKNLATIALPVPPLNEQRRIVAAIEEHLSRLDAAQASLETAIARARNFRDAVLEDAFGNHAPRRTVGEVAALADGPFGSNLKTSHYFAAGPRVVRLQNIGDGFFRDEKAHISQEHFDQLSKHAVVPGDVIVASLGDEAPRACLVPEWLGDAIVKADCIRARPETGVGGAYLMWALNSRPVKAQAATRIKGIGRPRLGLGGIRDLEIPVPPLEEQRRIVAEIEERLGAIDALRAAIERAQRRGAALRRSVLERAFRGELVPQDPSDEPASVLLDRIRAERAAATTARTRRPR